MKDEVFAYLDALHKKAGANMWEAPALVAKMFKINKATECTSRRSCNCAFRNVRFIC